MNNILLHKKREVIRQNKGLKRNGHVNLAQAKFYDLRDM